MSRRDSTIRIRRPLPEPQSDKGGTEKMVQPEVPTDDILKSTGVWFRGDHEPMQLAPIEPGEPERIPLVDIADTPAGRIAALSTVIIAGGGLLFAAMEKQDFESSDRYALVEQADFSDMSPAMEVEPFINKDGEQAGVRLELQHEGVEYGINFVDYTEVLDWELKPRSAEEMSAVIGDNIVYQALHEQYEQQVQAAKGIRYDTSTLEPPVKGRMDTAYDVYESDNAREADGIFKLYSEVLGNLGQNNESMFVVTLDDSKDKYGYGDTSELTYTEWMMRIDSPTRDLQYNYDWVVTDPNTEDVSEAVSYIKMPVDTLFAGGLSTCTGYERVAIASFEQDADRYDLVDRGIFRMTVSQLADARHAMGAYVLAHPTDPNEVYIIPVDVTNQQGDATSDAGDVRGAEFASWMLSANVFHDLDESLADRADVYDALLDGYALDHTARAITVRELVVTYIEQAEEETRMARREGREVNSTKVLTSYKKAYTRLSTELKQEAQSKDVFLLRPDRTLRLLFLQLELATQIKDMEQEVDPSAVSIEYNEALQMYNKYVAGMEVSPDEGLRVLASIDEMDSGMQSMIREHLEMEQKRLEDEMRLANEL